MTKVYRAQLLLNLKATIRYKAGFNLYLIVMNVKTEFNVMHAI